MPPPDARTKLQAVHIGLIVAILAYTALRVGSALSGEPDPRAIGPTEHVPYFWRCLFATWAGSVGGAFAWQFGPFSDRAETGTAKLSILLLVACFLALIALP